MGYRTGPLGALFILLLVIHLPYVLSAGCKGGTPKPGTPNNYPILSGPRVMTPIGSCPNGKAYVVTVPNGGGSNASNYTLIHIYGTPYQMGYAQGTLLKDRTHGLVSLVWDYLASKVVDALPNYLPKWLADLIATIGLDAALDFTETVTAEWTGRHFYEELRGLADATGVEYTTLLRIHMLAGLTQGKCSMLGAWGIALDPNSGTNLLQLRALDWDMNGPFRDFSQITVYHPAPGYGHAFANVGFTGFIGGLTGVSQAQLGISEIGVAYPDSSFGEESRIGVPFIFLLRDILQFDYTLDDALNRMINTRRTCDLLLGVGDGKLNQFRGVQYSYSVMNVFDDMNLRPINNTWHPRIPNVVYWAMDWLCPGYSTLMSRQLQKYHGKLSPAVGIQYVSPYEGSGDNHIAYYDLTKMQLYVSFAAPHNTTGPVAAYDRQYTQWDLRSLFAEPAP